MIEREPVADGAALAAPALLLLLSPSTPVGAAALAPDPLTIVVALKPAASRLEMMEAASAPETMVVSGARVMVPVMERAGGGEDGAVTKTVVVPDGATVTVTVASPPSPAVTVVVALAFSEADVEEAAAAEDPEEEPSSLSQVSSPLSSWPLSSVSGSHVSSVSSALATAMSFEAPVEWIVDKAFFWLVQVTLWGQRQTCVANNKKGSTYHTRLVGEGDGEAREAVRAAFSLPLVVDTSGQVAFNAGNIPSYIILVQ
jgi:hypothetical protein